MDGNCHCHPDPLAKSGEANARLLLEGPVCTSAVERSGTSAEDGTASTPCVRQGQLPLRKCLKKLAMKAKCQGLVTACLARLGFAHGATSSRDERFPGTGIREPSGGRGCCVEGISQVRTHGGIPRRNEDSVEDFPLAGIRAVSDHHHCTPAKACPKKGRRASVGGG